MIKISPELKEYFKWPDGTYNNIRITLDNGDIISGDRIVSESLSVTERACSGDTFKFGLCEAKTLEIECFDIEDIKGRKINVSVEKMKNEEKIGEVPYGEFIVNDCSKESVSGKRKIVAYDALKSSILDRDLSDMLREEKEDLFSPNCVIKFEQKMLNTLGLDKKEYESSSKSLVYGYPSKKTFGGATTDTYYLELQYKTFICTGLSDKEYYRFKIPSGIKDKRYKELKPYLEQYDIYDYADPVEGIYNALCELSLNSMYGYTKEIKENDDTYYTNINSISLRIAVAATIMYGTPTRYSGIKYFNFGYEETEEGVSIQEIKLSVLEKAPIVRDANSATLRNILQSMFELKGKFGRINRETGLIEDVSLNNGELYPKETLYPQENLFPSGAAGTISGDAIISAWFSESEQQKIGTLIINYKTLNAEGESEDAVYTEVFDESETGIYEVSGNWILENTLFSKEDIKEIAREMIGNIKGIYIMAFSAQMTGLPYMEAGDMLEIVDGKNCFHVYVLERTISGIQGMLDDISALGGDR